MIDNGKEGCMIDVQIGWVKWYDYIYLYAIPCSKSIRNLNVLVWIKQFV